MRVVVAPGRFDRSPRLLARDVERWTSAPDVSAVLFTEMADADRAAALIAEGWTTTHDDSGPGKGECAVMTKDDLREVVAVFVVKLTEGGGKGRLSKPIYALIVITKAPSGRLTLFAVSHLPAHLERIWSLLPGRLKTKVLLKRPHLSATVRTWLEATENLRDKVTHLAAEHHVDDVVVGNDWNLNSDRAWVRDLMAHLWPGLDIVRTKAPDLGRRNVGWLMTNMVFKSGKVHPAAASDHRAGEFEVRHLNRAPKDPKPVKPPPPFDHVVYNGALMDQKTKTAVQLGEKRLGYSLTILQGCYHPGVSQSAGTHDGGQVIDFAPFDFESKVRTFRKMGWFIWHRLPIPGVWGEHIHGGIRNGGTLSPSAASQQDDFDHYPVGKRDGLAGHNIDPDQYPPEPHAFDYAPEWHEIND